jgi:hypothetical protein
MPGEGKSTEISLKPLVSGEFERIIEIKFESEKAKVGVIGVKIKGVVSREEADTSPLLVILATPVAVVIIIFLWWKRRKRRG